MSFSDKKKNYFSKKKGNIFQDIKEYVHFCCTSEDINNISYSLLLNDAKNEELSKNIDLISNSILDFAKTVYKLILFIKKN